MAIKKTNKRIQVTVPGEVFDSLNNIALKNNTSLSKIVKNILLNYDKK